MINSQTVSLHSANQQAWLLLTVSETTPLAKLFKDGQSPIISWLYANTILHNDKDKGPLLVNVTNTPILADYQNAPDIWSAFLIYTQNTVSQEQLLNHLKKLLVIHLNPEELGILNYTDRRVASCFFYMPQKQLISWLGPIDTLIWHGGDFLAVTQNQQQLHTVQNPLPLAERDALPNEPQLTLEQTQLLEACQEQQYLLQWSKAINIDFLSAWQAYQEGLQQNFTDEHLEHFIKLRIYNKQQPMPNHYPEHITSQTQKIDYLKHYWTKATV